VFIGDGLSDRYAARCADVVFAKGSLAVFCDGASIPYEPYDSLHEVASFIERMPGGAGLWVRRLLPGQEFHSV
jgi:2-hydroxy-3-keto-5-methylthiopentenyl-1-phosphate phosphatase